MQKYSGLFLQARISLKHYIVHVCAKHRTIKFFLIIQPCFLHHYCFQILYTTNFLIENVFIYLLIVHVHMDVSYDSSKGIECLSMILLLCLAVEFAIDSLCSRKIREGCGPCCGYIDTFSVWAWIVRIDSTPC